MGAEWEPLVELRRYVLRPGGAQRLGTLFDQHFTAEHRRLGMGLLGPYLNVDQPLEMVWLRSFPSLEARHEGLSAFYDGPVWHEHRGAANDAMVDSSNAVLLEPAPGSPARRADPQLAPVTGSSLPALVVLGGRDRPGEADPDSFESALAATDLTVHRLWRTSSAPNTFPRLPLRRDELQVALVSTTSHDPRALESVRQELGPGPFELVALGEMGLEDEESDR